MFNKIFLSFLAAIIASPILIPSVLAEKPIIAANTNTDKSKQDIKKVIEKTYSSLNSGDIDGYLSTLSPTSKEYKKAVKEADSFKAMKGFKGLGVIVSLKQLDYTNVSSDRAEIRATLSAQMAKTGLLPELEKIQKSMPNNSTQKKSATNLPQSSLKKNQTSTGTIKLVKANGKWLITEFEEHKVATAASASTSSSVSTTFKTQPIRPADRKIFQQVFTKHLQALNQENLGNYLATLDLKSPNYPTAKTSTIKLFKDYDLKYELKAVDVISMGQQDAVVKLTATVKKLKGGEFTDSQMVTTNTVRKTNGQWRIYDTQVENISSLNTSPTKAVKR
jgi:ABC-type transporter MlaC component